MEKLVKPLSVGLKKKLGKVQVNMDNGSILNLEKRDELGHTES